MKLKRMRLRNFRCYKDEIAFDFDDMTAIIGKNDAGKSTILDALAIFLNDDTPDKDDASKGGDGKDLTIICEFAELPIEAIIDDAVPTSFKKEHLVNARGMLEIHKTYSGHTSSPKCTNICAFALHPTAENASDLLKLKNPELKRRAKELGCDLTGIDQKINSQLREKIRTFVSDLKPTLTLIPLNEDNAKKAWEGIKSYIPTLALFKSDRESTDQDSEAQDPLKAAVQEAARQKDTEFQALIAHVESEVRTLASQTLEKIKEMDPDLASQLNPQISTKKLESLFNVTITGDEDIPINKRGSGVRRLVLLNFFRAKAEQQFKMKPLSSVIYAIEEPETSQHPQNQRMLIAALQELSVENQVIITTHTPMLARTLPDTSIRYIDVKQDKSRRMLIGGGETNKLFTKSLGILPDNSVCLFIGVEGVLDISFLKKISKVLRDAGQDVLDLENMESNGEIIFFPLGGSSLVVWSSRLEKLCRPEFHLYDRDTQPPAVAKYQEHADKVNQRDRCKAVITEKREIENYLHIDAIKLAYSEQGISLPTSTPFSDFDDVPEKIAELVHSATVSSIPFNELDERTRKEKIRNAKKVLNGKASEKMTAKLLDEVDARGEIKQWFQHMKSLSEVT